jgi:hypothetical protein
MRRPRLERGATNHVQTEDFMELLDLLAGPIALAVLGLLAARFGRDSRDGIEAPPRTWLGAFR